MLATATLALPADTACDTVAVGLFEGKGIPHDIDGAMQALVDSGEARPSYRHLAVTHAAGKRLIVVGLGSRDALTPERLRIAAASVQERARDLGARRLCWELPHKVGAEHAAALVEGTSLSGYRFDRYKSPSADERPRLQELVVAAHDDHAETVRRALLVSEAVNRARDLQNTPPNDLTPMRLGDAALALAAEHEHLEGEVEGREEIEARGMGCFAAVGQGSHNEPALITLRYDPPDAVGPVLGLVGKAVTFDTGGISIKPAEQDGGHEVRHVRRRRRARRGRRDRRARAARPRRGRRRRDREHAGRPRVPPGRRAARVQRHDGRGAQHGRRGPAGPRRLPRACA